jgi:hypothetical protein
LVVCKLDRLARSTRDLLNTLDAIGRAGATFRSLGDPWADTTTPHGRLMLTVLGGLAEFERHLILSRTAEGRTRAQANGAEKSTSVSGLADGELGPMREEETEYLGAHLRSRCRWDGLLSAGYSVAPMPSSSRVVSRHPGLSNCSRTTSSCATLTDNPRIKDARCSPWRTHK